MDKKLSINLIIKFIFICLILIFVTIPFISFIKNKQNVLQKKELTLYSDYEYEMGIWIKDNKPHDSIIISDPETIHILSGLSGRYSIIPNTMLVEELQLSDYIKLKYIKENIFNTLNPDLAYNYSKIIGKNNHIIIIFSGRTAEWISKISYQFIQHPVPFYEIPGFTKFFNNSYFRLIKSFGNNQIFAFELVKRDYYYYNNYDIFYKNNIEEFDNITSYANDPNDAYNQWYLVKVIRSGPVLKYTYNQYYCRYGNPPIIKWNISIINSYDLVSLFVFNLNILYNKPNILWDYSKEGNTWISGNFSDPLQHIFDFKINSEKSISWLGHNTTPYNSSRLGTFLLIGFYY